MNISEAARRSGLPPKTIRYYEQIGLVAPVRRDNAYRDYDDKDVHELSFLARARGLGFGMDECRRLLALYRDDERSNVEVRAAAQAHLSRIRAKIGELKRMERTLSGLVAACRTDIRPDCPILEGVAGEGR